LDISKIYLTIENHLFLIELWDSNSTIQNSKIFENKFNSFFKYKFKFLFRFIHFIILNFNLKAYLKLCDVFIYVYNLNDLVSFESLVNFLNKINNCCRNCQNKKLLIILNDLVTKKIIFDNLFNYDKNDKIDKNDICANPVVIVSKDLQISMLELKKRYNFICCKLSELNKDFFREFLIDFI